uniref:Uncharacterized protein n=1 Tax=Zea mays TaxID=4577 RepID=C0HE26_MAIZE|nr:unknown [Zea mays]
MCGGCVPVPACRPGLECGSAAATVNWPSLSSCRVFFFQLSLSLSDSSLLFDKVRPCS